MSFTDVMRNAVSSLENSFTTNPLIDQATTDDEKPTPFYVHQEIIKLTFQGGAICERLLHHLMVKLQSERPSVKLKTLITMEHLLRKGHPHFQSSLQKEVARVRPCLGMNLWVFTCLIAIFVLLRMSLCVFVCFMWIVYLDVSNFSKTSEPPLIPCMETNLLDLLEIRLPYVSF